MGNNDLFIHGVRVRSQFPRYSEWYTAILEFEQKKDTPSVEQKWSVGQFFDKEGMFDEIGLQLEVEKLYRRLEDADYDSKGPEGRKKIKAVERTIIIGAKIVRINFAYQSHGK